MSRITRIWTVASTTLERVCGERARAVRQYFPALLLACISPLLLGQGAALAQSDSSAGAPEQAPVIDSPPGSGETVVLPTPLGALEKAQVLRLLFRSETSGVSFHLRLGATYRDVTAAAAKFGLDYHSEGYPVYSGEVATGYAPICETPCVATLFPGTYRMALALNEGYPLDVERAVLLETDSLVEGHYVDKTRMRRGGAMFGIVSMVAGTVMMLVAADFRNRRGINYPVLYSGVGLFSAGVIIGMSLSTRADKVEINVHPLEQ